jgi:hypothetical protein
LCPMRRLVSLGIRNFRTQLSETRHWKPNIKQKAPIIHALGTIGASYSRYTTRAPLRSSLEAWWWKLRFRRLMKAALPLSREQGRPIGLLTSAWVSKSSEVAYHLRLPIRFRRGYGGQWH